MIDDRKENVMKRFNMKGQFSSMLAVVEGILSAISTDNMITVISAREVTVEGYPAQCA